MKPAILLVAYGACTLEGRRVLAQFDLRVREVFPGHAVRWAYSSDILRKRLAGKRQKSDAVDKALLRMWFEHFETVILQPLQTIPGREFEELQADVARVVQETGMRIGVGEPLLTSEADIRRVASSLLQHLPLSRAASEDVIFMGHGSRHPAAVRYAQLHELVQALDKKVHVGTMEGLVTLDCLLPKLTSQRVWLMPLLATVGRHTLKDMAGCERTSWRCRLEASGHLCKPVLKGTVEHSAIAEIWLDHLLAAAHVPRPKTAKADPGPVCHDP
ncbi:MAG: sirohydrochlorin cobaltochelatase [Desulfovibrio sp.]|nr:sirohydrochlorin cobaltochelatase [Desulfovibrio sp.]